MLRHILILLPFLLFASACGPGQQAGQSDDEQNRMNVPMRTAADILGNPDFQAISYGGYREADHDIEPTVDQLKEDMKILHAMGIRVLRTYKLHLPHASNVVKAISELKAEDPQFEMYMMLGIWIDCLNAWTELPPDHDQESARNAEEVERAVALAKQHPDIIKVLAVGNEAMVKWAASYYVQPGVILKWVKYLQNLKASGELPADLWITSSDNFASWGGGGDEYHVEDLNELIRSVDFIAMHTYPMHDTHYNPVFWGSRPEEANDSDSARIQAAMVRSLDYAKAQYDSVRSYMQSLGVEKPIHITETGWASSSNGLYSPTRSRACDEYKMALYYQLIRDWTDKAGLSCFYFEAFDEPWKDAANPGGSENHFGLFTVDGQAKYAIWDLVDAGTFEGLTRDGNPIVKTHGGDAAVVMENALAPPMQ
ncbi:MAG: glycosyl hydrolase family 17 [Bacteroidetes bacterium]|nr:MAG: glycosyl hydrolase family 17 [Bacteroidota bacterium]